MYADTSEPNTYMQKLACLEPVLFVLWCHLMWSTTHHSPILLTYKKSSNDRIRKYTDRLLKILQIYNLYRTNHILNHTVPYPVPIIQKKVKYSLIQNQSVQLPLHCSLCHTYINKHTYHSTRQQDLRFPADH